MHNYTLGPVDTDSISICKPDMTAFTEEEKKHILDSINSLDGDLIKWTDDGTYDVVIAFAAKNYVLYSEGEIKLKGSSLRDSKIEIAISEMKKKLINAMVFDTKDYTEIFNTYVKEAMNVQDIMRWSSKKTFTMTILSSTRTNETNVLRALEGSDYRPGDKFHVFFDEDDKLCLTERFSGEYKKDRLLEKLYKSVKVFSTVIPTKELFVNYSLKKNKKLLEELLKT